MRIPQFNSQVAEADMPNVQISGGVTPGQAVDMVGNKIDGFANLANTVANKYKEIQDENDRVRVIDAQNKLAELRLHLENNDTDGYIKKKAQTWSVLMTGKAATLLITILVHIKTVLVKLLIS